MIPAAFDYSSPKTVAEALSALAGAGDEAKLLAGGQSLLPAMKLRLAQPSHLVDLGGIRDLSYVKEDGGKIAIGAMTNHADVESNATVKAKLPLLAACASQIGDGQVRNRGTLGGSLAHADPAADYPAAILALEAEIKVQSAKGSRSIAAADFFTGLLETALQPGEILTEVRFAPQAAKTGGVYVKFPHPASGFAVVGVAAVVTLDGSGKVEKVRIGVTGASAKAYRATAAESAIAGKAADAAAIAAAAAKATDGADLNGDSFASGDYRGVLVKAYVRRALEEAARRAKG